MFHLRAVSWASEARARGAQVALGHDRNVSGIASATDVHDFWFGSEPWGHQKMWFEMGRRLDDEVRTRFLPTVEAALAGDLDAWAAQPRSLICLIVVLDQFTRHVHRDDPRFVAGDTRAQGLAVQALDARLDESLRDDEALFLLTPLEHAEDADLQERALAEARRLSARGGALAQMPQYVRQHAAIVFLFGRFPDRNRILGRTSTPEEEAFLAAVRLPWFEQPA